MRQFGIMVAVTIAIAVAPARLTADTWCSTIWPDSVFCEDFDRYCTPLPPSPQECTSGSMDGSRFSTIWVPTGDASGFCGSPLYLDDSSESSSPYCAKMNTQQGGDFGYSVNSKVSDAIRNKFGTIYTAVSGTDLNPLVLEYVMNAQSSDKGRYDTTFMSMVLGTAYVPTNWAYSDFCGCTSFKPRFPIICQQETEVPGCPPIASAPPAAAIAAGFLVYLDTNPCHCNESYSGSPYNTHLSFFDGYKWYKLRAGLFPGSGDFLLRANENKIKLTVTSTKIKVELTTPSTNEYSWCEVSGAYTGPFSRLATGFHKACQLESDAWTCRSDPTCQVTRGVENGGVARYDNIVLNGGSPYSAPGACCFPDTQCTDGALPLDCQNLGGQYNGGGSTCAETACCPPLLTDHDMDGDVDMADFGWFQNCLSGTDVAPATVPCRCADFDNQGDVDSADFAKFLGCMLGADVAANPNCLN